MLRAGSPRLPWLWIAIRPSEIRPEHVTDQRAHTNAAQRDFDEEVIVLAAEDYEAQAGEADHLPAVEASADAGGQPTPVEGRAVERRHRAYIMMTLKRS